MSSKIVVGIVYWKSPILIQIRAGERLSGQVFEELSSV